MGKSQGRKPTLVVAGPGAGKTYAMVEQMSLSLGTLAPSRYLAAITFTNAAANSIRERMCQVASPGAMCSSVRFTVS